MTRIVAGDLGGRRIQVPAEGTRPTSERVREAVFNMIAARRDLDGARVLDLYAGSGALGIEAISRGATSAVFVEARRRAGSVIGDNLRACGVAARARVLTRPVAAVLSGPAESVDVVFLDPPYDVGADEVESALGRLTERWLAEGAMVVLERASRAQPISWPAELEVLVEKDYGDTTVALAGVVTTTATDPEAGR